MEPALVRTALELELETGEVVADTLGGESCVFLAGLYRAEQIIAERLHPLGKGQPPWPEIDAEKAIPWVRGGPGSHSPPASARPSTWRSAPRPGDHRRPKLLSPATAKAALRITEPWRLAMLEELETPDAIARYAHRKQTVEPVFGIIKAALGFTRFHLRGLAKVKAERTLVALACNFRRLHRLPLAS